MKSAATSYKYDEATDSFVPSSYRPLSFRKVVLEVSQDSRSTPSKQERQFFWAGIIQGVMLGYIITLAILGLTGAIK